jgi:hypothetical protein
MIEPQIHNGQRGVIGQQHGLQQLTETLEVLTQGQTTQQQRDTQIRERLATLTRHLALLTTQGKHLALAVGGLGLLTLGLAGIAGWQVWHPPQQQYAKALGSIDGVLAQTWGTLPKAVQEQLTTTYARLGIQGPGGRAMAK